MKNPLTMILVILLLFAVVIAIVFMRPSFDFIGSIIIFVSMIASYFLSKSFKNEMPVVSKLVSILSLIISTLAGFYVVYTLAFTFIAIFMNVDLF